MNNKVKTLDEEIWEDLPEYYQLRHYDAIKYLEVVHKCDKTTHVSNEDDYMAEIDAIEASGISHKIYNIMSDFEYDLFETGFATVCLFTPFDCVQAYERTVFDEDIETRWYVEDGDETKSWCTGASAVDSVADKVRKKYAETFGIPNYTKNNNKSDTKTIQDKNNTEKGIVPEVDADLSSYLCDRYHDIDTEIAQHKGLGNDITAIFKYNSIDDGHWPNRAGLPEAYQSLVTYQERHPEQNTCLLVDNKIGLRADRQFTEKEMNNYINKMYDLIFLPDNGYNNGCVLKNKSEEWIKCCNQEMNNETHGCNLDNAVKILQALEEEQSFEDVKSELETLDYTTGSKKRVMDIVTEFAPKGEEFADYIQSRERDKIINKGRDVTSKMESLTEEAEKKKEDQAQDSDDIGSK